VQNEWPLRNGRGFSRSDRAVIGRQFVSASVAVNHEALMDHLSTWVEIQKIL
jgi:hypothetical protein